MCSDHGLQIGPVQLLDPHRLSGPIAPGISEQVVLVLRRKGEAGNDVFQGYPAKVAGGIAPPVKEQRHHQNVVLGENRQPHIQIGQEALWVALEGPLGEPPTAHIPFGKVVLPSGDLDGHQPMIVVLPQIKAAGAP